MPKRTGETVCGRCGAKYTPPEWSVTKHGFCWNNNCRRAPHKKEYARVCRKAARRRQGDQRGQLSPALIPAPPPPAVPQWWYGTHSSGSGSSDDIHAAHALVCVVPTCRKETAEASSIKLLPQSKLKATSQTSECNITFLPEKRRRLCWTGEPEASPSKPAIVVVIDEPAEDVQNKANTAEGQTSGLPDLQVEIDNMLVFQSCGSAYPCLARTLQEAQPQ